MKYKIKSYVVSQIVEDYEKEVGKRNRLTFDYSTQRPGGLWANKDQSLLIHSMLQEYPVPNIYIVQNGADDFEPMDVLDGKQRLTITYNYITGGFKLSKATPPVRVLVPVVDEKGNLVKENGITQTRVEYIEIKNKKFSQLPKEFRDKIKNFEFTTTLITEADKEELDELIFRLNNGKATSAIHKAVMMGGSDVAEAIRLRILGNNFFSNRFVMSTAQEKNSEDMKCAFHVLALLTNAEFNKLTSGDLTKIAENMRKDWDFGKLTEQDIEYCNYLLETLNMWLPDDEEFDGKKILTSIHIPIMIMNVEKAIQMIDDGDLTETQYKDFLRYWVTSGFYSNEYTKCSEGSPSDRKNIENRIDFMEKELLRFIGIAIDDISEEIVENMTEITIEEAPADIRSFVENNSFDVKMPLKAFVLTTPECPYNAFDSDTLNKAIEWYRQYGEISMLDECSSLMRSVDEKLEITRENKNYPFYVFAAKLLCEFGIISDFKEWYNYFIPQGFGELEDEEKYNPLSNSTINIKQSIIRQSIYKFACEKNNINEGEETNDEI